MIRTAFLVSGRGLLLEQTILASKAGLIDADIRLVLGDRACGALRLAGKYGIESSNLDYQSNSEEVFFSAMKGLLESHGIDLVCLAFDRLIPSAIFETYPCFNVHSSLLPAFPGFRTFEKARERGVKFVGATIHRADASVDGGPIIIQSVRPVAPFTSPEEMGAVTFGDLRRMLPQAIQWFAEGRMEEREKTIIIRKASYEGVFINPALEEKFV